MCDDPDSAKMPSDQITLTPSPSPASAPVSPNIHARTAGKLPASSRRLPGPHRGQVFQFPHNVYGHAHGGWGDSARFRLAW